MKTVVLSTTYFGPIQWYQKLHRYDCSVVSREERFRKQSYRNRCVIATANGLQGLTVPVVHDAGKDIGTLRVSEHGNWRHVHWNALCSAYGDSPFFQYYADDIRPFFESRWEYLYDLNMAITVKMCELLDIHPNITDRLDGDVQGGVDDLTDAIDPKHGSVDPAFVPRRYYQVYERRYGFQPNLSILDLLFNEGNESVLYL